MPFGRAAGLSRHLAVTPPVRSLSFGVRGVFPGAALFITGFHVGGRDWYFTRQAIILRKVRLIRGPHGLRVGASLCSQSLWNPAGITTRLPDGSDWE